VTAQTSTNPFLILFDLEHRVVSPCQSVASPSPEVAKNTTSPLHVTTKRRTPSPAHGPCRLPHHWSCVAPPCKGRSTSPKRIHHCPNEPCRQLIEGAPRSVKKRHEGDYQEQIHHWGRQGCRLLPRAAGPPAARRGEDRRPATAHYLALLTTSSLVRPDPASSRHHRRMSGVEIGQNQTTTAVNRVGPHRPERRNTRRE
jgi:hypothetical protein